MTTTPTAALAKNPPATPGHFSDLERLAILLSLSRHDEAEGNELDHLAANPTLDWRALDRLVTHNAIRPWAYHLLSSRGHWHRVPAAIAEPWVAFAEKITAHNQRRLAVATPLFAAAAAAGLRIAILKGIYFAPTYYGEVGYKKMNDIDFLIPVSDLDPLLALYAEHGYFSLGLLLGDEKQTTFSHHTPPFFHPSLDCVLGTHWGLISPLTRYRPDYGAMWARAIPFNFLGHPHWALHPVDNLHHLCMHLPYYKTGLRELADLYNLIRQERDFDWALLEAEAAKAGTSELVFHALSLVQALVPMPAVSSALARLKPLVAGFYLRDTARRIGVPRRILVARSTHMSEIDKAFGEFTLSDHLPTKLRAYWGMWGNGLLAPRREVARFHYVDEDAWFLPLLYPSMFGRVLRYIAKDLGWKIFALVVFKNWLDLWKCAWRTARGRNKPSKLEAAANRNGLSTEQIATLRGLLE